MTRDVVVDGNFPGLGFAISACLPACAVADILKSILHLFIKIQSEYRPTYCVCLLVLTVTT